MRKGQEIIWYHKPSKSALCQRDRRRKHIHHERSSGRPTYSPFLWFWVQAKDDCSAGRCRSKILLHHQRDRKYFWVQYLALINAEMCYYCGTMQRCATAEGTPPASGLRQIYCAPDKGKEKLFPLMCGEGNLQWYNAEAYYHWGWRQDKNFFF